MQPERINKLLDYCKLQIEVKAENEKENSIYTYIHKLLNTKEGIEYIMRSSKKDLFEILREENLEEDPLGVVFTYLSIITYGIFESILMYINPSTDIFVEKEEAYNRKLYLMNLVLSNNFGYRELFNLLAIPAASFLKKYYPGVVESQIDFTLFPPFETFTIENLRNNLFPEWMKELLSEKEKK